jgi:hypothetical protein
MINFLRIAVGQDRGFAGYYRNRTKMTFGWGLEFAGHYLNSLFIALPIIQQPLQQPASMTLISIITGTQSGKPPEMPHNQPISFPGADYLFARKASPRSFQLQSLYRRDVLYR